MFIHAHIYHDNDDCKAVYIGHFDCFMSVLLGMSPEWPLLGQLNCTLSFIQS